MNYFLKSLDQLFQGLVWISLIVFAIWVFPTNPKISLVTTFINILFFPNWCYSLLLIFMFFLNCILKKFDLMLSPRLEKEISSLHSFSTDSHFVPSCNAILLRRTLLSSSIFKSNLLFIIHLKSHLVYWKA